MRGPLALVGAAALLSGLVVSGAPGSAVADGLTNLPSVTLPSPSVSLPLPSTSSAPLPQPSVSVPGTSNPQPGGGGGGGDGGSPQGGSGSGGTSGGQTSGRADGGQQPAAGQIKPMIADRPEAKELLDDESSPALYRASKQFLIADQGIAALSRLREAAAAAREGAQRAAADYRALTVEAGAARAQAFDLHSRRDKAARMLSAYARHAYETGQPLDEPSVAALAASTARLSDAATRAELRLGWLTTRQAKTRAEYDRFATKHQQATEALAGAAQRLRELAARRADALAAARASRSQDVGQYRTRLAESGQLGARIREAAAELRRSGRSVNGSGAFTKPGTGTLTSGYGMRRHPILGYVKLHTGVDLSRGNGAVYAADRGVVLFTMISEAYGNMTVVDHGTIGGRHVTTLYAHQARFLVDEGDRVSKGQPIGVIGSTGYATGPHLHFEVRDDGAVENPMPWLG